MALTSRLLQYQLIKKTRSKEKGTRACFRGLRPDKASMPRSGGNKKGARDHSVFKMIFPGKQTRCDRLLQGAEKNKVSVHHTVKTPIAIPPAKELKL